MSVLTTIADFEWPERDRYGKPGKNRVEIDVNTTITHDTIVVRAWVLPDEWEPLYDFEIAMSHDEALALADALREAVEQDNVA